MPALHRRSKTAALKIRYTKLAFFASLRKNSRMVLFLKFVFALAFGVIILALL